MDESMKVEKGTLADAPHIAAMAEKVHEENGEVLTDELKKELMSRVVDSLMDKTKMWLLVNKEEQRKKRGKVKMVKKTIGMVLVAFGMHPIDGKIANTDYLYVVPEYRGNGVFDVLADAGEMAIKGIGATKIYTESKPHVHEMLLKHGFKVESVIMSKEVK